MRKVREILTSDSMGVIITPHPSHTVPLVDHNFTVHLATSPGQRKCNCKETRVEKDRKQRRN